MKISTGFPKKGRKKTRKHGLSLKSSLNNTAMSIKWIKQASTQAMGRNTRKIFQALRTSGFYIRGRKSIKYGYLQPGSLTIYYLGFWRLIRERTSQRIGRLKCLSIDRRKARTIGLTFPFVARGQGCPADVQVSATQRE